MYHDITYDTAMTVAELKSGLNTLTTDIPFFAFMGELLVVYCEDLGKNWHVWIWMVCIHMQSHNYAKGDKPCYHASVILLYIPVFVEIYTVLMLNIHTTRPNVPRIWLYVLHNICTECHLSVDCNLTLSVGVFINSSLLAWSPAPLHQRTRLIIVHFHSPNQS